MHMLEVLFIFLLVLHGMIHLLGFVKAFKIAKVEQLKKPISKRVGVLWLMATLLFLLTAVSFAIGMRWWGIIAIPSLILSQVLIIKSWSDAKAGTIPNIIITLAVIASFGNLS